MSLISIAIAVLTVLTLAGLVLVIRGICGRRIGDHPHCRACGRDLFGLTDPPDRCPECGRDLSRSRAIAIGEFRRRRSSAMIGASLLLPLILAGSIALVGQWRGIKWIEHQPLWYLLQTIRPDNSANGTSDQLTEINRRWLGGTLSTEELDRLLDTLLAYQSDLQKPWIPQAGRLIETMRGAGLVSQESWNKYLITSQTPLLRLRQKTRTGDPIFAELEIASPRRIGSYFKNTSLIITSALVDGQAIKVKPNRTIMATNHSKPLAESVTIPSPLAPGRHDLSVGVTVSIHGSDSSDVVVESKLTLAQSFEIADDVASIVAIDDPAAAAPARKQLMPSEYVNARPVPGLFRGSDGSLSYEFDISALQSRPFDPAVAFDVIFRTRDREFIAGGFSAAGTAYPDPITLRTLPRRLGHVDVILRPSRERALANPAIIRWLNCEIVYTDVPIFVHDRAGQNVPEPADE